MKSQVQSALQKSLGVTVTRGKPVPPTKHGDATLQSLRNWRPEDVVFDVGANDGRTILRIDELLSHPRFFAFEPVGSTYQKLVEQTAPMDNVRCFQTALGETTEEKEIYVNEIDAMSSFSPDWGDSIRSEQVKVSTLDQTMKDLNVDFVHYLKIDTEGHELAVLRGAQQALSQSRIAALQVEVGFDQIEKKLVSLEEIRSFLAPFGYRLTGIFNQCHLLGDPPSDRPDDHVAPGSARILAYVDAMFLRIDGK